MLQQNKIVIAITGASGAIYAKILLGILRKLTEFDVSVVLSTNANQVATHELGCNEFNKKYYPEFHFFDKQDFNAPFASGSTNFKTMIVIPCSMGTLARIANGVSNDLITRSADVFIKEKKNLILVPRETPFNLIHINNMKTLILSGVSICPAIPSFYSLPKSLEMLSQTVVHRVCKLADIPVSSYKWNDE